MKSREPETRMTIDEHVARLVAEAPPLSSRQIAALTLIMAPVLAELAAEDAEATRG